MSSARHTALPAHPPLPPARTLWLLRRYDHHGPQLQEIATVHRSYDTALATLARHVHHQGWSAVHTTNASIPTCHDVIASYFDHDASHDHHVLTAGTHHDSQGRPRAWYTLTPLPTTYSTTDDEVPLRGALLRVRDESDDDPHHQPLTYHLDTPLGVAITLHPVAGAGVAVRIHPSDGPHVPRLPVTVWVDTETGFQRHDHYLP